MRKIFMLYAVIVVLAAATSCSKTLSSDNPGPIEEGSMETLQVNPDFTFNTAKEITVNIATLDNADNAVPGIRINILTDYPSEGGDLIASFITEEDGKYTGLIRIPSATDSLVIETKAIGFVNYQKRDIASSSLSCVLGGKTPEAYGIANMPHRLPSNILSTSKVSGVPNIKMLGTFNSLGVPNYLVKPNDVIDAALLSDVNTALPEYQPVPAYHPQYLEPTNETNLEIQKPSNVWVTFLHEGAGYRNVLCYYKYKLNHPPASANEIDTLYTIFPNVSYLNSGGGLISGNKVALGIFQPGEVIGWALMANAYNGSGISSGASIFYSNSNLNPETNASLKKHCILLNDLNREKLILSFEDINRQSSCDNDFNDAIFYVTANPIQGINTNKVALPEYTKKDADLDGITDDFDDYPTDASKAFNNYYPSQNTVGTLAFEDLWPSKGDYDFNDMVIDYNFNPITNGKNQIVQLKASLTVKAVGASLHSGFGFQLPVDPKSIASVNGTDIRGGSIMLNSNGTEANQSKATIIVFDDAFNELPWPGKEIGVNTAFGAPFVQPKTLNLIITFTTPVNASTFGLPPYNAFIFTDKDRSREVHLINQPPTDLVNKALLNTQNDNSNPSTGRYYVTANNLPFALDIFGPFDYPAEKKSITTAHLKFYTWASSGGIQYMDWFKAVSGYRNTSNIFSR